MRIIVYGAGGVGSVLGGRLHQSGANVVLVARPAHVDAIVTDGLRVRTGSGTDVIAVPAVSSIDQLTPGADDIVIITAKTQDTPPIHDALMTWNPDVAVVCGTNGIEHERMALRRFDRVYGMVIQMPVQFERPGEVTALFAPMNALVDVGHYPSGLDDTAVGLAALLDRSQFLSCEPDDEIMVKKRHKLLLNLGNAADAACGRDGRQARVAADAYREGEALFDTAGIVFRQPPERDQRYRDRLSALRFDIPEGETFLGGSTWQSLAKGARSLETDYFNGEILLVARQLGLPAPANSFLQRLAERMLRERIPAGHMRVDELDAAWDASRSTASAQGIGDTSTSVSR